VVAVMLVGAPSGMLLTMAALATASGQRAVRVFRQKVLRVLEDELVPTPARAKLLLHARDKSNLIPLRWSLSYQVTP
jgi:hypothetical protein